MKCLLFSGNIIFNGVIKRIWDKTSNPTVSILGVLISYGCNFCVCTLFIFQINH